MFRASTHNRAVVPGWWPALEVDIEQWRSWLAQVAAQREAMEAIAHASPALAARVTRICRGEAVSPQRARRAAEAVARYLLRLGGRATPCGLFAGVAPVQVGSSTTVSWGVDHQRHSTPAAQDMAAAVTAAENDPELLRELRVQANDLTIWRGGRLVVDGMPHLHQDHPAEVSVRAGTVLDAVLAEAAQSTPVLGLVEVITDRFPRATRDGIEAMVQGLVRHGVLISELRAPGTSTTPGTYLHHRLDAVDGTSSQPPSIDLRIDAAVQVPGQVAEEVAEAGRLLALTAGDTSGRRSWRDWHTCFVERFGAGAAVPVSAAVDPVEGVGWPEHLLPDHTPDPQPWQRRDRHLAALAQRAARHGATEVHLSAADLTALGAETGWAGWAPHLSVCAQIQATSRAELDYGRFDVVVGAVGRTGAALGGRLLDRLPPPQASDAIEALSTLPPTTHGAIVVQLSAPARQLDCDPLGRAPQVTRELLHVGEFGDGGLRVADLFVVADSRRLYLVDRDERVVEPMVAHTLAGHTLAPLVRFLGEVTTSALGPVRGFDWGPLVGLPWRPRLRVGRIILSPAAWRLDPADLPGRDASPTQWCAALARHREVEGIPEWVHLGDTDHRLRLNLTHDLDTHQLRLHLDRADGPVTVSQAAADEAWGWIDGHAHELLVPLASSTEPAPRPAVLDRLVTVTGREASLPADGPVLSALIDCDPRAIATLVTQRLPQLAEALDTEELWWLPMRQPRPHLRLRLATDDPSAAAARLSSWVAELRQAGLAGALTFDTFRPEVARYSAGAADPAAAMDAVQAVWTADSATAAVLLETARDHPELDPDAATAASLLDLTCAALGRDAGLAWLISHRELTGTAPIGDRGAIARAQTLWRDPPQALRQAWARRADAITAYRDRLGGLPGSVLVSLLHLHHVRVHQPDPAGEQARHRIARAVALAAHAPKGPRDHPHRDHPHPAR